MIHKIFSIYDSKAAAFLPPFILPKAEMAQRTFADCVNSPDHQFGAHPEDYTLFELGHWDDETGMADYYSTLKSLGLGVNYRVVKDDEIAMEGEPDAETNPVPPQKRNGPSVLAGPSSDDSTE